MMKRFALMIVVMLAIVTFAFLPSIRNPPTSGPGGLEGEGHDEDGRALTIDVNGQQYVWRYTYPDSDDNPLNNVFAYEEMVVPTDTTVVLA
ncbi:MAG: cytochrome c oxidase subunit II, partial [Acidobacteria bacterium]|nr:cytochrome c oxidase subunit II [Acidobacteriota bacterium]